ncbi:unnamed protein product [Paramecium primaurelia]|uniref:Uncharacterized protein n=1 Tax=Paramecium primaurelia TaxID=5886 RepID=A0A8S1NZP0_PARPR|nr:unnamed protein product [Paramecium primaurelia]
MKIQDQQFIQDMHLQVGMGYTLSIVQNYIQIDSIITKVIYVIQYTKIQNINVFQCINENSKIQLHMKKIIKILDLLYRVIANRFIIQRIIYEI